MIQNKVGFWRSKQETRVGEGCRKAGRRASTSAMVGEADAVPCDMQAHSTYGLRSSQGRRDLHLHTYSAHDRVAEFSKKACKYPQYPEGEWEAPSNPCTWSSGSNDSAGTTATDGGGCTHFPPPLDLLEVTTPSKVVTLIPPLPPSPCSAPSPSLLSGHEGSCLAREGLLPV